MHASQVSPSISNCSWHAHLPTTGLGNRQSTTADFRGLTVMQFVRDHPRMSGTQQNQGTQQSQSQRSNHEKKEKYCCDWNYTAKWDCHTTSASHSSNHRCRMCDTMDHPMLHCPKRKIPIPSTPTNQDSTKEWQLNILSCSCWLHESSSPVQFSGSKTHFHDSV